MTDIYTGSGNVVTTINIAPDWAFQAMVAIMLIENGEGEQGKEEGRKLVRDMAERLDQIRTERTN